MNAKRNTKRLLYHVFTLPLCTSSAKLQHPPVKLYHILPLWVKGLEFRKSFTHLSWSCYAAPRFALNSNLHDTNTVLMSENCTKKDQGKQSITWFYMKITNGSLCCFIEDCWSWLTLLVLFCGKHSVNVFCLFDNIVQILWAILYKPHYVLVLPVKLHFWQGRCV